MKLSYKSLLNRTMATMPFRGTNEYPMDSRSISYSRFSREEDGSYKIYYQHKYEHTPITKENYESLKKVNGVTVYGKVEDKMEWLEHEYSQLNRVRDHVATVRADNTIEIISRNLHQGLRMKLTDWTSGVVYQNCRLGGVIYADRYYWSNPTIIVPLFHGVILDADTMLPKQKVQLFKRKVNRKIAKELMMPYKEMLKVANAMVNNMTTDNLFAQAHDIFSEHAKMVKGYDGSDTKHLTSTDACNIAKELCDQGNYFDSAVLYMIGTNIIRQWYIRDKERPNWVRHEQDASEYANALINRLPKIMYRQEQPFDEEEIQIGTAYKGSEWGLKIVVNGVEVQQY
jgi:hypothetical protein